VPRHAGVIIKPKTLASILEQASVTVDQLRDLL
jgi:predicted RNA binding protein YcfA (HicA-like mRNA interferase family)